MPAVEVRARGSSVAGLTRVANGSLPSTHLPSTWLRSVRMGGEIAQFGAGGARSVRGRSRRGRGVARRLGGGPRKRLGLFRPRVREQGDGGGVLCQRGRLGLVRGAPRAGG